MEAESKRGNGMATWSLVLGLLAFASLLALAVGLALDQPWLMENDNGAWLILPVVALGGGGSAALLGGLAGADVRRGRTGEGRQAARIGTILGGIAAGVMVLAGIGLIVIFVVTVIALSNGS